MSGSRGRTSRGSIRTRVLATFVGLALAISAIAGFVGARRAAEGARKERVDRGKELAETLRRSNFPLNDAVLGQLKGLGGAEFVAVDNQGKIQAGTVVEAIQGEKISRLLGNIKNTDLSFEKIVMIHQAEMRVGVVERKSADGKSERLIILLPEATLRAAEREAREGAIAAGIVGAFLAATLALWVGANLARPLAKIHDAILRIGQADLDPKDLPRNRGDEIGELADAVVKLAERLKMLQDEHAKIERLRLVRQVGAGLAHELRNPLTAARLTLQIQIERDRDRDVEPLRIALGELERMERQVRRFLQLARPEPPSPAIAALGPIVARAVEVLAATAKHQQVCLVMEQVDHDLPDVFVDSDQIIQIITNLLNNAIDAAGPNGNARVRVGKIIDNRLAVEVADDGPGIREEDAAKLFQPFFSTKPEGVGLGLAVCAALAGEHSGSIEHDRREGWTVFRLILPAKIQT